MSAAAAVDVALGVDGGDHSEQQWQWGHETESCEANQQGTSWAMRRATSWVEKRERQQRDLGLALKSS